MTAPVKKLPLSEATLRRLIEAAKREGRLDDVRTLTVKAKYQAMMRSALSFLDDGNDDE